LKVTIANELRDQVEVFQTAEYPKFLSTLVPVFLDILQKEQPVFISNAPEQVSSLLLLILSAEVYILYCFSFNSSLPF
jgi:hypothetical protein